MNQEEKNRPNIIWIFGDQHRAQALGCAGDGNVHTPNIDRLSAEGLMCTAATSGFPLCCPFRGSLLTSRYPHQCVPGHEYRMPPDQPTIAAAFRQADYHTAYFGKWHLDGFHEKTGRAAFHIVPPDRRGGFDKWIGYENNNSQWDSWVHGNDGDSAFHYRLDGFETDVLTDMFIEHINERGTMSQKPFFAALSVQPPHDPYVAPAQWMQRHTPATIQLRKNVPDMPRVTEQARRELAGYYAMIENLDWNLGRIRQALFKTGLEENTHIIFFSDHGDMHGSHGQFRKTSPYEESIRIPFIIGGGLNTYGRFTGQEPILINHVDIAPTTLGLCGIDKPDWMCGTDFSGYRLPQRHKPAVPDSAFLQQNISPGHQDTVDRPWRGIVTQDGWKYAVLSGQPWMMFNLKEDPYELANLALDRRYSEQRTRLQERLAAWINDTHDEFQLPDI